jgi:hypothetical protein
MHNRASGKTIDGLMRISIRHARAVRAQPVYRKAASGHAALAQYAWRIV